MPEMNFACSGPVPRRACLEWGGLGLLGLGLSDLLRAEARAIEQGRKSSNKSVILVWLPGGPPHMETYDMKPEAPAEFRGAFDPIRTNVSGIDVCELLPLHAKCADRYNIVRSVHHDFRDHGGAHKRVMTGRIPASPVDTVNDAPSVMSLVNKALNDPRQPLPASIACVDSGADRIDRYALGAAYLGPSTTPYIVAGDPSAPGFKLQNVGVSPAMAARLDDRLHLLSAIDGLEREIDKSGLMDAMDDFGQRAAMMLTSPKVREAFDLGREPEAVRDRYGRHPYGQRALMARRLVEGGSRFVTVVWQQPHARMPKNCTHNWDSHAVNCDAFADTRWRLPYYDQALTALIEDLYERGLSDDVLLIATGEFGRTPKIKNAIGTKTGVVQPGRDHWPDAMSMLVCGGGMCTGQVIGATNSRGEHPIERPLSPDDIWATVYRHLQIDYEETFPDFQGRPMPILPSGEPVEELLPA